MSVIKEINHRGYTAEICYDVDANNPLDFSSWRIHIFGNENILLGDSVDKSLDLENEAASSDFELVDILTRLSGKAFLGLHSIQECADLIREQGKYLVYFLRVKSFANSDPLMVELHTAPSNLIHDFTDGIIYTEMEGLNMGQCDTYEETLGAYEEDAQAVLNEWLAWYNNEMLCTYISDSDGDNVEILGGLLTMEEAIDESIRLIDELRDRELQQLAKTNLEAAVISLIRERGSKEEGLLEFLTNYVMNVIDVMSILQITSIPYSKWLTGSGERLMVKIDSRKVTALKELTTALTTNLTTYQKEDNE